MPNDKYCVGCPYRKSNGWCMLTACANQKRYNISNYVVRVTYAKSNADLPQIGRNGNADPTMCGSG